MMVSDTAKTAFGSITTATGIICATLIIGTGITSCEKTYQRAFEAGYTSCVIAGSTGVHWCKDGKEVQE